MMYRCIVCAIVCAIAHAALWHNPAQTINKVTNCTVVPHLIKGHSRETTPLLERRQISMQQA